MTSKTPWYRKVPAMSKDEAAQKCGEYKKAYEEAITGKKIKKYGYCILIVLLAALVIITVKSKYSVFTYFTDYKSNMENELIDTSMKNGNRRLMTGQKALEKEEKELKDKQKYAENNK